MSVWGRMRLPLGIILPFLLIGFAFLSGEFLEQALRSDQDLSRSTRAVDQVKARLAAKLPRPCGEQDLLGAGLPVYDLRIGPNQLARIYSTIDKVQARGNALGLEPWGYERASFLFGEEWVEIRVKLRGFEANHFNKARPSLRLKFPSERPYRGMRLLNLVDPYDKGLTADITTAWEASRHGIMAWRSGFVVLRVNGEVWGIYMEIEQPDAALIARNDRSEGPIYSPNGILYGRAAPENARAESTLARVAACRDPLAPGGTCDWEFVRRTFDPDRMAWGAAIMGLCGHWGAWLADNLRLYYDPARGRFEPIPWDYGTWALTEGPTDWSVFPGRPPPGSLIGWGEGLSELGVVLLGIPEFRRLRNERLWTLVTERIPAMTAHADSLYDTLDAAFACDERAADRGRARREHEGFLATLRANADLHRRLLSRNGLGVGLPSDLRGQSPSLPEITFENREKSEVLVLAIVVDASGDSREIPLVPPLLVPGRWMDEPGRARARPALPALGRVSGVRATNAITGAELREEEIELRPHASTAGSPDPPPLPPEIPDLAGLTLKDGVAQLGPGRVDLHRTLVLPEGLPLRLAAGLDLRLAPGVSVLVQGDLTASGRSDRPISVGPLDPESPWGALAVLGRRESPARVTLLYTLIEGGSGDVSLRVPVSGSLSVHDGVVMLDHVTLRNVPGEDAINFKYCQVDLKDSRIEGAVSDAIDLDYCRGRATGLVILNTGGDGIDLSGSVLVLEDNLIRDAGDKGVSIGEQSHPLLVRQRIERARMGVGVKDASVAVLREVSITGSEVGVGAYVKKLEYAGPVALLEGVTLLHCVTSYLRDPAGWIVVDGDTLR